MKPNIYFRNQDRISEIVILYEIKLEEKRIE